MGLNFEVLADFDHSAKNLLCGIREIKFSRKIWKKGMIREIIQFQKITCKNCQQQTSPQPPGVMSSIYLMMT